MSSPACLCTDGGRGSHVLRTSQSKPPQHLTRSFACGLVTKRAHPVQHQRAGQVAVVQRRGLPVRLRQALHRHHSVCHPGAPRLRRLTQSGYEAARIEAGYALCVGGLLPAADSLCLDRLILWADWTGADAGLCRDSNSRAEAPWAEASEQPSCWAAYPSRLTALTWLCGASLDQACLGQLVDTCQKQEWRPPVSGLHAKCQTSNCCRELGASLARQRTKAMGAETILCWTMAALVDRILPPGGCIL